jgi:hypothetical protein
VEVLRQADPRWGKKKLGTSTTSIAAAGCLATCYAQALRFLGVDDDATPASVVEVGNATRGAFLRASIVQPVLSKALGLKASDPVASVQGAQAVRAHIVAGLDRSAPGVVILHVDHDSDRAGGDIDGDHFVLAIDISNDSIHYCDPATGALGSLDLRTMSGMAAWGTTLRRYEVRSARALVRAA